MMIMIDPLSELCGLCVELLSTTLEPARPQRVLLVWMGEQRATRHMCPLPNFTPQPTSRGTRHISEHKRYVSDTHWIKSRCCKLLEVCNLTYSTILVHIWSSGRQESSLFQRVLYNDKVAYWLSLLEFRRLSGWNFSAYRVSRKISSKVLDILQNSFLDRVQFHMPQHMTFLYFNLNFLEDRDPNSVIFCKGLAHVSDVIEEA